MWGGGYTVSMSRTSTLILFGILTILTPFSGLPISIRTLLTVLLGAASTTIGLVIRAEEARAHQHSSETVMPQEASESGDSASTAGMSSI